MLARRYIAFLSFLFIITQVKGQSGNPTTHPGTIAADKSVFVLGRDLIYILNTDTPYSYVPGSGKCSWEKSTGNGVWTALDNSTDRYEWRETPGTVGTFYYRRKLYYYHSNEVSVTVVNPLKGGIIGTSQYLNAGATPAAFSNVSSPTGGDNTFSYQWQQSQDEMTWSNISGANSVGYQPAATQSTIYFRRKVTSVGLTAYSNAVQVFAAGSSALIVPANGVTNATAPVQNLPDYTTVASSALWNNMAVQIKRPDVTTWDSPPFGFSDNDYARKSTYMDGLMRPLQEINYKASTSGKDIITGHTYDNFGQEVYQPLPYIAPTDASNQGKFRTDIATQQPAFFTDLTQGKENYFYTTQKEEVSILPQIAKKFQPGNSLTGAGKGIREQLRTNYANESIRIWQVGDGDDDVPVSTGTYSVGSLLVTVSTDEDENRTLSYNNRDGQLVMKSLQQAGSDNAADAIITYYAYDQKGNLRYVIPPLATRYCMVTNVWDFSSMSTVLSQLCYKYVVDARGRLVSYQQPGYDGPIYLVYDGRDRVVLYQDPNLRSRGQGEWLLFFYDLLDRQKMTALYKNETATRESLQSMMDQNDVVRTSQTITIPAISDLYVGNRTAGQNTYAATQSVTLGVGFSSNSGDSYAISADPTLSPSTETIEGSKTSGVEFTNYEPLAIVYYDDYEWDGAQKYSTDFILNAGSNKYPVTVTPYYSIRGKITGVKQRILGTENWLKNTYYYDKFGNVIQVHNDNITGGEDVTTRQYNYTGQILGEHTIIRNLRSVETPEIRRQRRYEYENDQLVGIYHTILGTDQTEKQISQFVYDDLGRNTEVNLGGLETIKYSYDFKNRLTGINADFARDKNADNYFGMDISYESGFSQNNSDGQISGVSWRRKGDPDAGHAYGYKYNESGSLLNADYSQNTGDTWSNSQEDYRTYGLEYDKNGNITKMKQDGMLLGKVKANVDNLQYTYDNNNYSNRLKTVSDAAGNQQQGDFADGANASIEYNYDANGNITHDLNRGITISYNAFNGKVSKVTLDANPTSYFENIYDFAGRKLQRIVYNGDNKNTYTDINGFVFRNDSLLYFPTDAGRVRMNANRSMVYDYFIVDNLGNTRTVITDETNIVYYKATHEDNPQPTPAIPERESFSFPNSVDDIPATSPFYDYNGTTNRKYVRLNNSDPSRKVGTAKVLRVMAGDKVELGVQSYFASTSAANNTANDLTEQIVSDIVNGLLGVTNVIPNGHTNIVEGVNNGYIINKDDLNSFITDKNNNNLPSEVPKAYLNYILFDDNFKMVEGHPVRVSTAGAIVPLTGELNVKKNGYLYVYVSNESNTDVYFDDLTVKHTTGNLLQEDSYYPFGLQIRALSSRAINRIQHNYLYNGIEKISDFDLGIYDAFYRTLDPQIGRWQQIDPAAGSYTGISGYNSNFNDPINMMDPLGNDPIFQGPGTGITLPEVVVVGKMPVAKALEAGGSFVFTVAEAQQMFLAARKSVIISNYNRAFALLDKVFSPTAQVGDNLSKFNPIKLEAVPPTTVMEFPTPPSISAASDCFACPAIGRQKAYFRELYNSMYTTDAGASFRMLSSVGEIVGGELAAAKVASVGSYAFAAVLGKANNFKSVAGRTVFYRAMNPEAAAIFEQAPHIMPASGTGETMVSPSLKYVMDNYRGVVFEIEVLPETVTKLEAIGVRNNAIGHPYPHMPIVEGGWMETKAFFKIERRKILNIGLGRGDKGALNIFNTDIQGIKVLRR